MIYVPQITASLVIFNEGVDNATAAEHGKAAFFMYYVGSEPTAWPG